MIQTIRKAWGVPELRKKIVFTLLILLIFRIGNAIPVPYINTTLLGNYLDSMSGTVLGLYNVMSGGAFAEATVFALGVQPYINSSIIIQLLTIAIPALERLARDGGEAGKKKIASITRYRGDRPASGLWLLHDLQELQHPRAAGHLAGARDHRFVCCRFFVRDVAGRAGQ